MLVYEIYLRTQECNKTVNIFDFEICTYSMFKENTRNIRCVNFRRYISVLVKRKRDSYENSTEHVNFKKS